MVFDSHHHVDVAFLCEEVDGISRFGARNRARLVFRSVVAAFELTPEVNHFTFDCVLVIPFAAWNAGGGPVGRGAKAGRKTFNETFNDFFNNRVRSV